MPCATGCGSLLLRMILLWTMVTWASPWLYDRTPATSSLCNDTPRRRRSFHRAHTALRVAETGGQHPHRALPDVVGLEGRELARLPMNPVGCQAACRGPGSVDELSFRVQAEGAGHRLRRDPADGRQPPIGRYRKASNAVVPPIGHVEKLSQWGELNLRAGVPPRVPLGECGDRLEGGQRPRGGIEAIARHAAALLVRKVDDVLAGMKAIVTR